jgi:hypothetical protein
MESEDPGAAIVRKYNIMKIKEASTQLGELVQPATPNETKEQSHIEFIRLMRDEIDTIVRDLEKTEESKSVVKAALQGLHRLDALGFVLQNLMEVVKRDESFRDTVERYSKLGILKSIQKILPADQKTNPWFSSANVWRLLESVKSQFRKIAFRLISILLNTLKTVPMFVKLKPSPSIGWSGFLPTIALEFELDIEGVALNELIDVLLQSSDE